MTVWTSDAGDKWAANWAGWDGYADFWSDLVRDTFPLSGSEGQQVSARISEGLMTVKLESSDPFPSGTDPKVRVSYPDGTGTEVRLDRVNEFEFSAVVPARTGGSYAVGASFESDQGETVVMSAVATRSFAAEYLPGESDTELMASISSNTGGRGEILSSQAFDPDGLDPGVTEKTYRWWFLLAAALLWPIDVALRRLRFGRREPLPPLSPPEGHPTTPTKPAASRTP